MSRYIRDVDTPEEQFLMSRGWVPRGLALWEHPDTLKLSFFTLDQALEKTEELHLKPNADEELIRQIKYSEFCMDHMFELLTRSIKLVDNRRQARRKFVGYYKDDTGKLDHAKIKRCPIGKTS